MGYRYIRAKKTIGDNANAGTSVERVRKLRALNCIPYGVGAGDGVLRKSIFGKWNNIFIKNW